MSAAANSSVPGHVAEIESLRSQLEAERQRFAAVAQELERAKAQNFATQRAYEEEEEFITNRLLDKLDKLKADRAALVQEVEAEEDFLVNTLYRRLAQVQKEKLEVETRLGSEHDMASSLQRRLDDLAAERRRLVREKADLENTLEAEQEYISLKLGKQVEKLAAEKAGLAREKGELQRQVGDLSAAVAQSRQEKVDMEAALEAEEEAVVNRLQRQLQQVTTAYRALESRMELAGMSPRADGAPAIDAFTDWVYGRSPSRNSDHRLAGSRRSRERERSLSVSSTSSMRDASHMSGGMDVGIPATHPMHISGGFHSASTMHSGPLMHHGSASSSPSHRRRIAAAAGMSQLNSLQQAGMAGPMNTQPL